MNRLKALVIGNDEKDIGPWIRLPVGTGCQYQCKYAKWEKIVIFHTRLII